MVQVYHPNIDLEGNVCLNILREDWKPVLSINSIIYGLQYLFLVSTSLFCLLSKFFPLHTERDLLSILYPYVVLYGRDVRESCNSICIVSILCMLMCFFSSSGWKHSESFELYLDITSMSIVACGYICCTYIVRV